MKCDIAWLFFEGEDLVAVGNLWIPSLTLIQDDTNQLNSSILLTSGSGWVSTGKSGKVNTI